VSGARVHILGAGAWGTARAQAAVGAGCAVTLHARDPEVVEEINTKHRNQAALGAQPISHRVKATIGVTGMGDAEIVLCTVPAQHTREALAEIGPDILAGKPIVLCAKGFETGTLRLQTGIVEDLAPDARTLVLSGPSFAADVAAGRPTAVTLAAEDPALAERIAAELAGPALRLYAAGDPKGVEIAGGLKNVYALASGAVEGADLGLSARSALIARAYAEMSRFVTVMGGNPATLTGLAGLGDLTLSCTSPQSRNYWFGAQLGRGKTVAEIQAEGAPLTEGLTTAPVALEIARTYNIEAPLVEAVNALLTGKLAIGDIVSTLMTRPLKREEGS
jgi:glycerol-3-phosphate dehydrogenase (NAD(P)+)